MSQKINVKGITKSPAKKEDVMGWNIYTLKHTTAADIFNQISRKAETSRDNQTVEYQLLLEARALVSSALTSSQDKQTESEQEPLTTLLKYCNGLLAGVSLFLRKSRGARANGLDSIVCGPTTTAIRPRCSSSPKCGPWMCAISSWKRSRRAWARRAARAKRSLTIQSWVCTLPSISTSIRLCSLTTA